MRFLASFLTAFLPAGSAMAACDAPPTIPVSAEGRVLSLIALVLAGAGLTCLGLAFRSFTKFLQLRKSGAEESLCKQAKLDAARYLVSGGGLLTSSLVALLLAAEHGANWMGCN